MLQVKQLFGIGAKRSEGSQPFKLIAANTTNGTMVSATPCLVSLIVAINVAAAVRYLKLYDLARAPVVGTDVVTRLIPIPAQTTGAGFLIQPGVPLRFNNGLALAITTGVADTDTTAPTANDVVLNLEIV